MSKMLMKWEDLLPGDVVEINPDFIKERDEPWLKKYVDKKLIICYINNNREGIINIGFEGFHPGFDFWLYKDGSLGAGSSTPLLKIIELKKEN